MSFRAVLVTAVALAVGLLLVGDRAGRSPPTESEAPSEPSAPEALSSETLVPEPPPEWRPFCGIEDGEEFSLATGYLAGVKQQCLGSGELCVELVRLVHTEPPRGPNQSHVTWIEFALKIRTAKVPEPRSEEDWLETEVGVDRLKLQGHRASLCGAPARIRILADLTGDDYGYYSMWVRGIVEQL